MDFNNCPLNYYITIDFIIICECDAIKCLYFHANQQRYQIRFNVKFHVDI